MAEKITMLCAHCGMKVTKYASNYPSPPNKLFCNRYCQNKWREATTTYECKTCKCSFRSDNPADYCSRPCYYIGRTVKALSPIKYRAGWQVLREAIRARDLNTCQLCGKENLEPKKWAIHHIDGDSREEKNLVTVCATCHHALTCVENTERLIQEYGLEKIAAISGAAKRLLGKD